MLGLFGTLNLANRSLQAHRQASEVTGHNLANVNNPAYARQRLSLQTAPSVPDISLGQQGTGVDVVAVTQIRDTLLDRQIQIETSVRGSLEARQSALEIAQSAFGQELDRNASGAEGTAAAGGAGAQRALAHNLSEFFNGFHSLASNPSSMAERQVLVIKVQDLTTQFHQVAGRLDNLTQTLNTELNEEITSINSLLADVARLNQQIVRAELAGRGQANDLRDLRQQHIEDLSKLVRIDTASDPSGELHVAIAGVELVHGPNQLDTLESYDAGQGRLLIRTRTGGVEIQPTGGSVHGTLDARDGEVARQRADLDTLASQLITEVNALHAPAYSLRGTTGAPFFTGTNAATIQVNATLASDPSLIQIAGQPDAAGDNQAALAIARLGDRRLDSLGQQTFLERYHQSVARLGQEIASTTNALSDQQVMERMLTTRRESVSGVSIDEEMTDMIRFQKAFEASAKLLTTVDEMLETVLSLKR